MSVIRLDGRLYAQVDVVDVNKPEEVAPGKKVLLLGAPKEAAPPPIPSQLLLGAPEEATPPPNPNQL